MNLINNGIEAMRNTDRTRELAIELLGSELAKVPVSIGDSGVGIPSQQMDQIFHDFCTIKPHRTGIGLRISGTIIRSHGRRLWAAANSPCSAFYFTLLTEFESHVAEQED